MLVYVSTERFENKRSGYKMREVDIGRYVEVQFNHWLKFYFPLVLDMVMYDNELETKENKI